MIYTNPDMYVKKQPWELRKGEHLELLNRLGEGAISNGSDSFNYHDLDGYWRFDVPYTVRRRYSSKYTRKPRTQREADAQAKYWQERKAYKQSKRRK